MMSLQIEVSRNADEYMVWFGTLTTFRVAYFQTKAEAMEFARRKFEKMRTRYIIDSTEVDQ